MFTDVHNVSISRHDFCLTIELHVEMIGFFVQESPSRLSTDLVAARRNATFLRILADSHGADAEPCDVDRSAYKLSLEHPTLLNTVPFPETVKSRWSWRRDPETESPFVIRLPETYRWLWDSSSPETIRTVNGTIGKALRYIYYGNELDP
jgi:hypothetical protein